MKKITRFFLLVVAIAASTNMGFATLPKIDFETVGNSWGWTTFENNPTWSVVANPSVTGINTSANVGKLVIKNTDQLWAGVQCAKGDFGPFSITTGNSTIKIMVYKDVISPVGIKFETAVGASKGEIKVSNTKINEWEELTFDFSSQIDNSFIYDRIVFFTDFPSVRTAGSTTYIDNVLYDTSIPDTSIPTAFTATKGTVAASSVELLLTATDNSGSVTYDITYGSTTVSTTGTSGVQKSYTISALNPSTAYSFSVVAKDASGNLASNNPIVIDATTIAGVANTECSGTSTQSVDGSAFTLGYNYTFATVGTDVTVTFECLDSKVGLVAYLWNRTSGFSETQMTNSSGQIFTKTLTGQTPGATITVACKFAFAGGMSVTKDFTYTVGNSCSAGPADTQAPTAFTATNGAVSSTSVELLLNATDNSGNVVFDITYGATTVSTNSTSGVQKSYIVTGLTASTAYNFSVVAKDVTGNTALNNPNVVSVTTSGGMSAATTPTIDAAKVMSVYSDTYTALPTVLQDWYGNNFSTVLLTGNTTMKNTTVCCFGYEFSAKPIDVSSMTKLHVDIYPETLATMTFGIVTTGGEFKKSNIALTAGQWNSIDVSLSDFAGADLTKVNQIGFWDLNGTFYLDNLYLYNNIVAGDTSAPTAFTASKGAVSSSTVELLLEATDNSGSVTFDITYGATTVSTTSSSAVQKSYIVTGLTASTAYSFSVIAKDATGNLAANNPIVVSATTSAGMGAAPVPTVNATKVMSVFSDTYTALPNSLQNWYGNNFSSVSLTGNETLKNTTICCFGYEFTAKPIDVSTMTKLHVDIYPETTVTMTIGLVTTGENKKSGISLTAGQWNSLDIALTDFTGAVLTGVNQIGFWDLNYTFYLDNLYFYNDNVTRLEEVTTAPSINCYPNPAQNELTISAKSEMTEVTVRNLLGQSITSEVVNGKTKTIDVSRLNAGNYLIVAKMSNGMVSTQKFSKL